MLFSSFRKGLLCTLSGPQNFLLATMQSGSELAHHPVGTVDAKIDMDWDRRAYMFEDGFAFVRFSFKERLINQNSHIFLCSQLGKGLG